MFKISAGYQSASSDISNQLSTHTSDFFVAFIAFYPFISTSNKLSKEEKHPKWISFHMQLQPEMSLQ